MILTSFASVDNLAKRSIGDLKFAFKNINPAQTIKISIIFCVDMPKITAYVLQNSMNNIKTIN